jgi:pimeloyl-ACP methyl ester carboxylesterase
VCTALRATGATSIISRALEGGERQVFCPDIVARGKSDRLANPADYNYAQYLTDLTALIARTDAESVDLLGTSMGGRIGMLLAAEPNAPARARTCNPMIPKSCCRISAGTT